VISASAFAAQKQCIGARICCQTILRKASEWTLRKANWNEINQPQNSGLIAPSKFMTGSNGRKRAYLTVFVQH